MPARVWPRHPRFTKPRCGEGSLITACLWYLRAQGCLVWRSNTGAMKIGTRFIRFGRPGVSDIVGVAPGGRAVLVETKRAPNRLTEEQAKFLDKARRLGAFAMCVYDVGELDRAWKVEHVRR